MGTTIKRLREAAGLTQQDMSTQLGMATQYYQQIEAGKRNPRTETTVKIARFLAAKLGRKPSAVLAELTAVNEQPVTAA